MVAEGHRAVMLYLVQRTDCDHFQLAADIDPAYARALDQAEAGGGEVLVYGTKLDPTGVSLGAQLPRCAPHC